MAVPLTLAVPATAATLAYIDAKYAVSHDLRTISRVVRGLLYRRQLDKTDRHNSFYLFESHALNPATADRVFLIYQGEEWTYKAAYDTVLKYATWLKQYHQVAPKEVVAMDFMNCPTFLWIWLALWSLGAKPAFINYNLTAKPLSHSVKTSSARLLLVDEEVAPSFTAEVMETLSSPSSSSGAPVEVVTFSNVLKDKILSMDGHRAPDSDRGGDQGTDMAMLIYTSGTTGLPKPAIVTWDRLNRGRPFVAGFLGLKPTDRFFTGMPLYHSAAAMLALNTVLQAPCTLVLAHRFSASTFWSEVRASRATIIQYVGETCRYLLSAPASPLDKTHSVRVAFGNGLRPDVWEPFKARFGIDTVAEFYGATEGPGALWNLSRNTFTSGAVSRSGPVMRALFGSGAALVAMDADNEAPARDPRTGFCVRIKPGANTPGELIQKLPEQDIAQSFQGYYNNPGASSSKVLRDVFVKGDAWYRTGDLLRNDAEGRNYFVDRIGDTFRWKGENVSTAEVADAVGGFAPVAEACVYGVQLPGHDGRAGCAAVVFREDVAVDEKVLADLAAFVQRALPRYAVPIFVRVTKSLEATGTNKHMKAVLKQDGVDPARVGAKGDAIYWLVEGRYVPYGEREWKELNSGRVKL